MLIAIALPFILISLIIGFVAKKCPTEHYFNRFVLIALTTGVIIESLLTKEVNAMQSSFIIALILCYIGNLVSNKYISYLFTAIASSVILLTMYIDGFSINYIAIISLFIGLSYYSLRTYKNEVTFTLMQIIPLSIAFIYLQTEVVAFVIAVMVFLGSIRFFIESNISRMPKFFIQAFMLIISMFIISTQAVQFIPNMIILLAGFAFMLTSISIDKLFKNKHTILQRLMYLDDLHLILYLKVFLFNAISISLAFLVKFGFINTYILIGYIAIVLLYCFAKMWYKENEHLL